MYKDRPQGASGHATTLQHPARGDSAQGTALILPGKVPGSCRERSGTERNGAVRVSSARAASKMGWEARAYPPAPSPTTPGTRKGRNKRGGAETAPPAPGLRWQTLKERCRRACREQARAQPRRRPQASRARAETTQKGRKPLQGVPKHLFSREGGGSVA